MVCDWYNCYFSFWALHFSFTPLTAQKWKFQKNEKTNKLGDTFILHKRAKNHDHMLYCSLDLACDGCNCYFFLGGGAIICPFTPLTARKMKISNKWKKNPGDIIILHKCTKKYDHILYCSQDMARDRCNYFSFWAIFCPFTPVTA